MPTVILRKELGCFRPVCDEGEGILRRMTLGQQVMVKFSFPRNTGHHRKFFALMQLIFNNQSHFATMDHLLAAFKFACGHTEKIRTTRGIIEVPKSISFAKMDQAEFEAFYNRAVDFVTEEVIPGLNKDDLANEVAELCR
jgi:hypothetical protein